MKNYSKSNTTLLEKHEKELAEKLKNIAETIKLRRVQKGLTQVELAELSGINDRTIQLIETGKHWFGLRAYLIICHVLDMNYPLPKGEGVLRHS